ncbi:MAG TPA: hypothetical protein VLK37_12630 [Solirubrobacterales bacterium]|nr:hypothetical protein [Solirubrobacterales bacterium]
MPSLWKQVGVLLAMGVLAASSAAPASGADWALRTVGDSIMLGISCPTTSRCVAGGAGNTVLSSEDPTAGASGWKSVNVGAGEQGPYFSPSRQIRAVDCPAPGFCVAVSYEGLIYTSTNPTGDAGAWSAADLSPEGPNIHMYGLDCPTANLCVAVATGGKILTTTDPAGGVGAWTVTQLPSPLYLRGISCASANLCVAVGDEGEIVSSTQPLGGAGAWSETQLPGAPIDRFLLGIACPAASLCVTGNTVNTLFTSTNPTGGAGAWTPAQGKSTVQITDVDCPSPTQCVAIDNNGDVLTSTNPTGGAAAWTFQNVLAYTEGPKDMLNPNGMFGISCPSTALCAIAATHGQILTSTNPFDPPPAPAPTKKAKKKHRKHKGPKRPRAIIASRPPPGIEIARGKAKIRFRFFAANHASVRGYVCKLDKRHFKPCKSPKSYRVGFGKHWFSVRAVGWTGYRGKAATLGPFKVCHPTNGIYCMER